MFIIISDYGSTKQAATLSEDELRVLAECNDIIINVHEETGTIREYDGHEWIEIDEL